MLRGKTVDPIHSSKTLFQAALLVWVFLLGISASTRAQMPESSQGIDVGVLVTSRQEEADAILKRLKEGADFAVLAKEKSVVPSAKDGGYLGHINPATLPPAFRDALSGLSPGHYSNVVNTPLGYAIFTVFAAPPRMPDGGAQRFKQLFTTGAILPDIPVSGQVEANTAFLAYPKPDHWDLDLQEVCEIQRHSQASAIARMEKALSQPVPPNTSGADLAQAHAALAQLYTFVGDMDSAIREWKAVYEIAQSSIEGTVPFMQATLGVAYLHKSEMENQSYHNSSTLDLFPPLDPTAHYDKQEDSQQAVDYFLAYLKQKPADVQVKWLLNLSYVTLGEYPAKVPPEYLIPVSVFESKDNVGRFRDVAPAAGLNVYSEAGGVVVDDFDNDGLLDVITSSTNRCEPLHYFHNNGDGTFTDRNVEAGLSNQLGGLNIVAADYNNDGCLDLLVLRGGWEFPIRKSLLRNNCNGTFTDVTKESGLLEPVTATQTAVWADVDNDGHLDLFIGNENAPSQLFRNNGDGTFTDIAHAAGVDQTAMSKGVTAADYDNDGYVDLYVSNMYGPNFLYHNNHDRTFTEIAQQAGVQTPYYSFSTWFFDYDNDGWPDLFVTDYFYSVDQVMRSYLGLPYQMETLKLYRNLHNGAFQDETAQVGLDKVSMPMGSNFGDVDNDGFLDLYLGMGNPSFSALLPHVLLRNKEGKSFVDITASSGTGELHKGHGIAFADLERTGHEDIIAEIGGAVPSDKHTMRVFQNPGNGNDWINVRLTGVKSNRSAIGAQIKVTVQNDGGTARSIYRTVGGTSSFGGNPLEQHIGLGPRARILSLEVWWPASDTRQKFDHVGKNDFIAITEFSTGYTKLKRQPIRLGGTHTALVSK